MKNRLLLTFLLAISNISVFGQSYQYNNSPEDAAFITDDIKRFWEAFDALNNSINPFEKYINNGTVGLKDFIPNRIISADSLLFKVKNNKDYYLKTRDFYFSKKEILPYYYSLKYWYPYAKFPPIYFVVGRLNSAGTVSDNGIIIGVEKLSSGVDLSFLIIHECIHFQQKKLNRSYNLLEQSIIEGSADFIAELVTGKFSNQKLHDYCNLHQEEILRSFVVDMYDDDYGQWLYSPTKNDQPKDIGYWIGYKICESIYNQAKDKRLVINRIINETNYQSLLKESKFLDEYLRPKVLSISPFENYSKNVDFRHTELVVTFNQEIFGSSFSPMIDEGFNFPLESIIGYSEDHRSFSLKMKLEPNSEYAFKLTGRGFQNKAGYSLQEYEVKFTTREE